MGQITGAVVAITVVLTAVFVPSALQSGTAGAIYKQFALTIAMSMLFSAFLALVFTPALCATILKPHGHESRNIVFRWFNSAFDWVRKTYIGHIGSAVSHAPRWMILFVVIAILCGLLFTRLPGSFLPEEDQGYALAIVQLPPGATFAAHERGHGSGAVDAREAGRLRRHDAHHRLQFRRPGRERRHGVRAPEAVGRA